MKAYHFWSVNCDPCKRLKPLFEELKEDFSNYEWISVNINDDPEKYTAKFGVKSVPALAVEGQTIQQCSGNDPSVYYKTLKSAN